MALAIFGALLRGARFIVRDKGKETAKCRQRQLRVFTLARRSLLDVLEKCQHLGTRQMFQVETLRACFDVEQRIGETGARHRDTPNTVR